MSYNVWIRSCEIKFSGLGGFERSRIEGKERVPITPLNRYDIWQVAYLNEKEAVMK